MTPINQILNKKVLLAFSLILSILFFSNFIYAPAITSCGQTISSPGTYWLNSNITCNSNSFINITSDNVIFDGNDFALTYGYTDYLINVSNSDEVYINNLNIIDNSDYGIYVYSDTNNNDVYFNNINIISDGNNLTFETIQDGFGLGLSGGHVIIIPIYGVDNTINIYNSNFNGNNNIVLDSNIGSRATVNGAYSNNNIYIESSDFNYTNYMFYELKSLKGVIYIFGSDKLYFTQNHNFKYIIDSNIYSDTNQLIHSEIIDRVLHSDGINSRYGLTYFFYDTNIDNKDINFIAVADGYNLSNKQIYLDNPTGYDYGFEANSFYMLNNIFEYDSNIEFINSNLIDINSSELNNVSIIGDTSISNIRGSDINNISGVSTITNINDSNIYNLNISLTVSNMYTSNLFDSNIYKISNIYSSNLENIILSNTLGYVYDTNINILSSTSTGNISNCNISDLTTTSTGSISYSDISNSNSLLNPTNKDAKITSSNIFNSDINLDYTYLGGFGIKHSSSNMIYDSNIYNSNININNQYNPSVLNNSIVNSSVYDSIITKTGYDLLVPFYNSYISNIDLNHFRLISSDINSCDINNSTIETSDIFNSVFYDINISNSDLIDSNLFINMILSNNTYDNVFAINTSLSDLETSGLGFIDSNVYDSEISDANIFNSDLNNSSFYDCDINGSRFYDLSNDTNIETSNITDSNFIDYVFDTYYTFVNNFYEVIGTLYLDMYDGSDFNTFIFKFVDTNTVIPTTGLTTRYYSYYGSNSPTGDIKPLFNNFMWYIYYDTYGNRYDPFIDLSIYGNRLYLDFTIEDVNTPIVPDLVEINGVDVTSYIDVNGHIDGISEYGLNTIHIESSGYRDKDIQLYLYDDRSYNISLISEENSGDVQFSFKYPDLTTVNTKRFEVYDTNTNQLVGSDYTTSTGYVEFALDSAQAYYEFRLIYNDTNDENYYSYVAKPVTVKVPLNESDGTTLITPFDISVEGLGVADYLGVTTDTNVLIITNTVSKYTFIITPDLNYCSRTYNISIPGDPDAYILQPYLVDTDNCSQVYMYTYNKATSQPIGGVDIYIYRQIPGYAVQLVEFLTTDDTGIGISNLYAYKSYTIKLFYDNIEITNYDLVISNARYNFYLDLSGTSTGTTEEQNIYNIEFSDFDGNTPNGYLYKTDLNTIRFWQDITVENGSFYENTIYNIQVISDNNTLLDKNYNMTEGHTLYTTNDILDFSLFDSTGMSYTKLCGTIYVDGESVYNICANFIVKDSSYWNLSGDLKNFLNTLSTFQKVLFMVIIMLIFITITAVFTKDSFVIFFIGAGILGFFEFIIGDTAMITVWATGVLGGAALLIWKNGLR